MSNNRGSKATALATLVIVGALTACSGGGGSTPTTPTSVTVTCPNGTTQTAATTELANTACPAPTLVSITPTNGSLTASPDSFTGIQVATDSVLDPASLTTANVTLKVGSLTTVAGTVSATDTKGFKFVPTAKLQYGQTYNFMATVKDMVGKILTVNSTFTTAYVTCTLPQVPNSTGTACVDPTPVCTAPAVKHATLNACIYPVGVQKSIPATELPASMTSVTDTAFLSATVTGEALLIDTGAKATNAVIVADRTRDIVFAVYRYTGYYVEKPLFKDTLRSIGGNDNMTAYALAGTQIVDRFQGSADGMLVRFQPGNVCALATWDTGNVGFGFVQSSACPIWN